MSCQKDCMLIGIAGGTGSGKSTFTNRIKKQFGDDVTVIYHDNYYRRRDDIPFEERKKINYDHPDALETDMLIEHIKQLKAGKSVVCPVYDFSVHNRSDKTVEADADERILRRVLRDVEERGRDLRGIIDQYLTTVKPMHYRFVEPSKAKADIVINSGLNDVAYDIVSTKIQAYLDGKNDS